MEEQILQRNKKSGAAAGSPNIILPGKTQLFFRLSVNSSKNSLATVFSDS